MRPADIARLSQPLPGGPDVGGRAPVAALGVEIPVWDAREGRIFADLTEDPPYGIGWWAPHPGTSRRILISDQLYACTASVSTNLVEAGIHLLELTTPSSAKTISMPTRSKSCGERPRCDFGRERRRSRH